MKIIFLTPGVFDKGGISRYNRYQILALRELAGEENIVVLSRRGPTGRQDDLETPFLVNWHGHGEALSLLDRVAFFKKMQQFVFRQRPNLIWCAHLRLSGLARLMAYLVGAKTVVQVYGREAWTPVRFRADIYWGLRHSDYVVSDCYFTAQYIENEGYRPAGSVEVMWDCVDSERFSPGPPNPAVCQRYGIPYPTTSFNILTLGRLTKSAAYKGYERLLKVFVRLPKYCHLIYGGGGDLIPILKDRARALRENRIIFTGFINEVDLPDIYRTASVFCLISDRGQGRGEGIPLTPLEAASCGVPILVGNQDGSREAVVQGVNGFSLDPFDLDAITYHLQRLAKDETYRQRLGKAARARIEQEHTYPIFRERMRRFLNKIG